ncbi:alpha/beta-hydrolase [Obba rivulosa]|uniref:Alpha/beta-hydrolase n=1 Tax=Obba rivulosa TaxID=1052685 RepID=A0A8E2AKF8_9APHY|nr:alpha/beta-hydrolase [Obba rivulosa]
MAMEPSSFKDLITSRGIKYHYFVSRGEQSKPTLLLLHGFISTSHDWRKQVSFFQKAGHSLIVPDLLGYGGTDKPEDLTLYKQSILCADIVEILDAEDVDKAIAIGHDWGCVTASRLANYYPERFSAFAFLAIGYIHPRWPDFDYETLLVKMNEAVGYDVYGYWDFFTEDGADKLIETHIESFVSLIYSSDPQVWQTDLAPKGAIKKWILADRKMPLPSYMNDEEKHALMQLLVQNGISAPLRWYKALVHGQFAEDDQKILHERYSIQQPVFFGACEKDYIFPPVLELAKIPKYCPNLTVKEFETDHWVHLAAPDELNTALEEWIGSVGNE